LAFKDVEDVYGNTPAHIAAKWGHLPDDFDFMAFKNIKDSNGNTPAHLVAINGHLPDAFDYREFKDCKDEEGNTPAHLAAWIGYLPDDFNYMAFKDFKNDDGETPAHLAKRYNNLPKRPLAGQDPFTGSRPPVGQGPLWVIPRDPLRIPRDDSKTPEKQKPLTIHLKRIVDRGREQRNPARLADLMQS
jgi:ankyrin repeat protein